MVYYMIICIHRSFTHHSQNYTMPQQST